MLSSSGQSTWVGVTGAWPSSKDLDMLSFVRIIWLIGLDFKRMDSKRKVSQVFSNNPQGSRLRRRKKRWWNFLQTGINKFRISNWKARPKIRD